MLLREFEVIDDIRRSIREVRDSLFSSGDEDTSLAGVDSGIASPFVRDEIDILLSERPILANEGRRDPPDDVDMLPFSDLFIIESVVVVGSRGASGAAGAAGAAGASCSMVNSLD